MSAGSQPFWIDSQIGGFFEISPKGDCEVFITGANFFGTSQCPQGARVGCSVDFKHTHWATPPSWRVCAKHSHAVG